MRQDELWKCEGCYCVVDLEEKGCCEQCCEWVILMFVYFVVVSCVFVVVRYFLLFELRVKSVQVIVLNVRCFVMWWVSCGYIWLLVVLYVRRSFVSFFLLKIIRCVVMLMVGLLMWVLFQLIILLMCFVLLMSIWFMQRLLCIIMEKFGYDELLLSQCCYWWRCLLFIMNLCWMWLMLLVIF